MHWCTAIHTGLSLIHILKNVDGDVTNTLVIKGGVADMTSADCPDHLCVKQKAISKEGESKMCIRDSHYDVWQLFYKLAAQLFFAYVIFI